MLFGEFRGFVDYKTDADHVRGVMDIVPITDFRREDSKALRFCWLTPHSRHQIPDYDSKHFGGDHDHSAGKQDGQAVHSAQGSFSRRRSSRQVQDYTRYHFQVCAKSFQPV